MKRLIQLLAVIALLNLMTSVALGDGPGIAAQPNLHPDSSRPTMGGAATVTPGDAGPAAISSSDPVAASTDTAPSPGGDTRGGTSVSGPGTKATAPARASSSQPDPSVPDRAPSPTTTGPTTDANTSGSTLTASPSGARADLRSNALAAFGGSADGVGYAQDPTSASTCTSGEASPGVPATASLGTTCGGEPTTASEDASTAGPSGSGGSGNPTAASCLMAGASAGVPASARLSGTCASGSGGGQSSTNSSTNDDGSRAAVMQSGATGTGETATAITHTGLPGLAGLPSTATEAATGSALGLVLLWVAMLLLRARRATVV